MRQHLAKVYGCLGATTAFATAGAYAFMADIYRTDIMGVFATIGLLLGLYMWRDNGKNFMARFGMLMAFGLVTGNRKIDPCPVPVTPIEFLFSGNSLGPLLNMAAAISPKIIVTALVSTSLVFVSFTAAALVAKRGQYLFLGGILMSVLSYMTLFSLANLFLRAQVIYQGQMYIGLATMSAFILYDTQAIMEKFRMGNRDPITHSLDLFFDLVSVFRRLLVILSQKEERNQRKKRN